MKILFLFNVNPLKLCIKYLKKNDDEKNLDKNYFYSYLKDI
jgi:hypothetical protein